MITARRLELTAREFFCGAIGLSVGNAMHTNLPMSELMKVLHKTAERYLIPKEDVQAIMDALDKEFGKDAKVQ